MTTVTDRVEAPPIVDIQLDTYRWKDWFKKLHRKLSYQEGTWTPTFTSLTEVLGGGSVSKSGRYTRIGRLVFFEVTIVTAGGATTASTAGTTYHNLPIASTQYGNSQASNAVTLVAIGNGIIDHTNDRNYPPTWAATGNTIIITGIYEC